jgi:hypothetical protein
MMSKQQAYNMPTMFNSLWIGIVPATSTIVMVNDFSAEVPKCLHGMAHREIDKSL